MWIGIQWRKSRERNFVTMREGWGVVDWFGRGLNCRGGGSKMNSKGLTGGNNAIESRV